MQVFVWIADLDGMVQKTGCGRMPCISVGSGQIDMIIPLGISTKVGSIVASMSYLQ